MQGKWKKKRNKQSVTIALSAILIAATTMATATPVLSAAPLTIPKAFAAVGAAQPFNDIAGSFAKDSILRLYQEQILAGTSPNTFSPARPVTRAEFVTMLNRMLGLEQANSPVSPFADVDRKAWYYGSVQAAVQLGLADGIAPNQFAPSKPVTRQEAAVLLGRALKQNGTAKGPASYNDGKELASWAEASVAAMQELGLMLGDRNGRFRPKDSLTRQETAAVLDRALLNKQWSEELATEPAQRIQLGWQYGQSTAEFERSVKQSTVNTLSPRWYFTESAGKIKDGTDQALLQWAKANHKTVWAMVGNRSNQELTHQLLSNRQYRETLVQNLADQARKYKLDGLNIDFENVAPKDRNDMTAFIRSLAEKLRPLGVVLSVNVSPDRDSDWTEAFDYKELGKLANYIVLMGYDEHWDGSPIAGSVASWPYINDYTFKLLESVPASKTILALPFYNRDWILDESGKSTSSRILSLQEQNDLLLKRQLKPLWNEPLAQYTVNYASGGSSHRIWLEDGRSLARKYRVAVTQELAGAAYWYIGGESPDIWASLRNAERYYGYVFK
ncbi:S-layer homology domain-containing protein [Paenibacillus sp. NPDC058071]|uniref:S-layer homology domain-containing protein n=1 Tax=Paenibacillus sp. NPDC058071 TaxID=3346326 RepID=UPI0036DAAFAE